MKTYKSQLWTRCVALQLCVTYGLTFYPVICNVRDACTCFQPYEIDTISYQIPISDLPLVAIINSETFPPNSIDLDELYWYSTHEQSARDGEYPGLYTYSGAFTLGFFAGITIKTNYVTIDSNGYTLAQHKLFYFRQRFSSLIEMPSQSFVPGQGLAYWGAENDFDAQYITIKNGNLGLISHHEIHGNEITITNLNIYSFDVTCIQCNSCRNLLISDCIIGPSLGRHTNSRALSPRLKQLIDDGYGDEQVTYCNRNTQTVSDIIYRLINQMDMIYNYINNPSQFAINVSDELNDIERRHNQPLPCLIHNKFIHPSEFVLIH